MLETITLIVAWTVALTGGGYLVAFGATLGHTAAKHLQHVLTSKFAVRRLRRHIPSLAPTRAYKIVPPRRDQGDNAA